MFDDAVSTFGDCITVVDFGKLNGGATARVARIPHLSGVYAWFQSHKLTSEFVKDSSPQTFAAKLFEMAERKHCLSRKGRIKPLYQVTLQSKKTIAVGKKKLIEDLCHKDVFRTEIAQILRLSVLFQQPLYIGKATNLRQRTRDHLQGRSDLKARLNSVGINLDICWLMYATISTAMDESAELAAEELLSRLFHPLFTKRYG